MLNEMQQQAKKKLQGMGVPGSYLDQREAQMPPKNYASANKSAPAPGAAIPVGAPVTGVDPIQSSLRSWLDGGAAPAMAPAPNAAQSAKPRTAPTTATEQGAWRPSTTGGLANIIKPAMTDTYQVPGLGKPQSLYYSAPQQRQTAAGTPDQGMNYGYEDRRATWYPQLTAQQLARAPWLNAGNDSAFKRALGSGFTVDELTDATPWTEGQRFTASGSPISLGQARLEGSVPPDYKAPAGAPAQAQQASGNISALREMVNPFNQEYQRRLQGQYQQTARDAYARQPQAIREAFAARGLSQGGTSGIEAQALAEATQQFQRDLGGASDKAFMETVQAQNDFGLRRALGLDTYDLANRGLLQGDKQFSQRLALDEVLGKGGLANDTRRLDLAAEEQRQTLPGRAEALQLGNEATRTATNRMRQLTAPEVTDAIARASESASRARVTGATEQDAIQRSGQQVQAGNIQNEQAQANLAQDRQLNPLQKAQALQQLAAAGVNYQKLQADMQEYSASLERARKKEEAGLALTEMELEDLRFARSPAGQALGFFKGLLPGLGSAAGAYAGTESGAASIAALLAKLGAGGGGGG